MKRYLFDLDSTLIVGYMDRPDKNFAAVELLPGVLETWKRLRWETGNNMAIVTNQAGVAFGFVTEAAVIEKFAKVAAALGYCWIEVCDGANNDDPETLDLGTAFRPGAEGVLRFFVCYADSRSKDPRHNDPIQVARRKPSGVMLQEAMVREEGTPIYIGDRPEDEQAARTADFAFQWAEEFFHGSN